MERRIFKKTGQAVSLLGFGGMRLPTLEGNAGKIDKKAARRMIDRALEGGVNYFDSAYGYHEGASELFFGEALTRHPRDSYNLATKMPAWPLTSRKDAERIFEDQLRKTKAEYFDFYLLHNVSKTTLPIFEKYGIYEFLVEQRQKGLLRHLGFSFHDRPPLLRQLTEKYRWDFAQIQLNYLDWDTQDAKGQYEILAGQSIPVVVMEPVRGGGLVSLSQASADVLRQANPKVTTASWAIRFAASLPGVLTVLSGMSDIEQLEDNLKTMSPLVPLTQEEHSVIQKAVEVFRKNATVPCTACRYCMDCPSGVDIPAVFALYNHYKVDGRAFPFTMGYNSLDQAGPGSCTACRSCEEKCPQNIDIHQWMDTIQKTAGELSAK